MAELPTPETQARVASEAAQSFVDHYYESLSRRHALDGYYASASPALAAASVKPDLSINGRVCAAPADYEALLETQGAPVHYEVGTFDAQPVNPCYRIGCPESLGGTGAGATTRSGGGGGAAAKSIREGERISFAVQVGGTVKYGRGDEAVERAFNEAWVLVPHWEAHARNAPRGLRRWVVVSQNLRVL